MAHAIHSLSARASEPFIEVNCAAIPEDLIESELFGHRKGSFPGALEDKTGKLQKADGGTLFLDEVGDMSLKTQAKLLRSLDEQRFEPVGAATSIQSMCGSSPLPTKIWKKKSSAATSARIYSTA